MADPRSVTEGREAAQLPLSLLLALGWLVPGLGHLLLRRRLRAAVFFGVITVSFVVGIFLQGELILPQPGDPLSYVAAIAIIGNGVPFFVAKYLGLGHGVVTSAAYEFGNTFLLTAGMMNLLLLLDIHEIVRGHKEW
ncbi:MAG: hypothetical protein KA072_06055 [Thermoanaerobaculaceae bacterium]|nr:hypothetical protein [Thermoanaerobaculaceae bacterium]MDI9622047.1 hypothetical protein [Acidobacteriota bacterium]NLH12785.1 hypothetical protein [Holophagae bacterium]HPW54837.1 hypothetical protein [Thermoanaerobaculaceae bacterium]